MCAALNLCSTLAWPVGISCKSNLLWHAEIPSNATVTTKNKVQKVGEKAGMWLLLFPEKGNDLVVAGFDEGAATVDDLGTNSEIADGSMSSNSELTYSRLTPLLNYPYERVPMSIEELLSQSCRPSIRAANTQMKTQQ